MAVVAGAPPVLKAIWLIDRPGFYVQLDALFNYRRGASADQGYVLPFDGIPIYQCTQKAIAATVAQNLSKLDQSQIDKLYPFREPGIWFEMSKGPHKQLLFVDGHPKLVNIED
jgi:hypothetical protein